MDYKKRAVLYLLKKRGKTLGLFVLFFIISVLLVTCFSLLRAFEQFASDIRSSIGASFYIRASTNISNNPDGESKIIQNEIHITNEEIQNILGCGKISYYNPINYGYAKSNDLLFIPGEKNTRENNMGRVFALNYSALSADFTDGVLSLAAGRHIVESDTNCIMISESLAAANDLTVGDCVQLKSAELGEKDSQYIDCYVGERKEIEVQIIGIYEIEQIDIVQTATAGVQDNRIYASLDLLEKLNESEAGVYSGEVGFYVTDPAELNDIVSKVQEMSSINWENHFIRTNDFNYSQMADKLLSLANLMKLLILSTTIAGLVILILILVFRMRERIYEVGIMVSIGISKKEILKQFILEMLMILLVAFGTACVVSLGINLILEKNMLGNYQLDIINNVLVRTGRKEVLNIRKYLNLSIDEIGIIFIGQFISIIVAIFCASVPVIKMQPREILVELS